jgi:hypothetical protein
VLSFVLDVQGLGRPKQEQHPSQGVFDEKTRDPQEADHALTVPQRGRELVVTARPSRM